MASGQPVRIAILGGGPAGVVAAYWLSRPEQNGRYAVTLYTQGWRLGGKCASGRNMDLGARIEEHGLHMLMGCYENAFTTLRDAYTDWRQLKPDPGSAFQTWEDAFLPQRLVTVMSQDGPGTPPSWSPWNFNCPQLPGKPGDPVDEVIDDLIVRACEMLIGQTPDEAPFAALLKPALEALIQVLKDPLTGNIGGVKAALVSAGQAVQQSIGQTQMLAQLQAPALPPGWPNVSDITDFLQSLQRLAILADLVVAIGLGYLRDILGQGAGAYDALDSVDFRTWLSSNGASGETLSSAPVQAFYDLTFAAVGGNPQNWSIAAGCALRAQLEIAVGYRDAPLWKMAAGMGDTVFTPLYEVLTARGVKVEFFTRITGLSASAGGQLDSIEVTTQATMADGTPYAPLIPVPYGQGQSLDCWPNQPLWDQLTNGAQLQADGVDFEKSWCTVSEGPPIQLTAGVDFDIAILAMPPEAIRSVGDSLVLNSARWGDALGESASVGTQSLQLWLKPDLDGLGWQDGSTVLTSFVEPYDSWGDMSQVIPAENWGAANTPGSIAYFCGCYALPGGTINPPKAEQGAAIEATNWMGTNLSTLWPKAGPADPDNPNFLGRYDVANFDLSDLYVQTPAGNNVAARFSPATPADFGNLYVVGDWTKTRFSGGCFESAVESAMLASRAISGFPPNVKTG